MTQVREQHLDLDATADALHRAAGKSTPRQPNSGAFPPEDDTPPPNYDATYQTLSFRGTITTSSRRSG